MTHQAKRIQGMPRTKFGFLCQSDRFVAAFDTDLRVLCAFSRFDAAFDTIPLFLCALQVVGEGLTARGAARGSRRYGKG